MARVYLTRRALLDIDAIDHYSQEHWGERVPKQYLADLHAAMDRLAERPGLLRRDSGYSLRLRFYRVREHVLICDIVAENVYVLTVKHSVMDLPSRIEELEPQLVVEAELLHKRITRQG